MIVRRSPEQHVYASANQTWGRAFHAGQSGEPWTELSYPLSTRKQPEQRVRVEVLDDRGGVAWSNPLFH